MIILNEKKSNVGSPYVYYTVEAEHTNRTTNTVDLNVNITSHLASSSSSLGSGSSYGINGYLTINGTEYQFTLKSTSESWSGTTKHSVSRTLTIEDLPSSLTKLENIKFRAIRTNNSTSSAGYLSSTACSNIEIPIGHQNPDNLTYTIEETNQLLINAGINNNIIVANLSNKRFTIDAELYDDANISSIAIFNKINFSRQNVSSLPAQIDYDFSQKELYLNDEQIKVPIAVQVVDSLGGIIFNNNTTSLNDAFDYYDYIPYTKISIIESSTYVKRYGQMSGNVRINLKGNFFKENVGNINQNDNYKPTIKYKFWEQGKSEPTDYDNTINPDNITIENNNFIVNNYEIGSQVLTSLNYFNPQKAYFVKIKVEDNFTNYESNNKSIPFGDSTWTEFKDRVDFKEITRKGKKIVIEPNVIWEGAWYMIASHTITFDKLLSEYPNGILLMWSGYSNGQPQNWDWRLTFIPNFAGVFLNGGGIFEVLGGSNGVQTTKYIYIYDDKIVGNNNNGSDGYVLRRIIGF